MAGLGKKVAPTAAWRPPGTDENAKPPARFLTVGFEEIQLLEGEREFFDELPLEEKAPPGHVMAATLDICRMGMTRLQVESVTGHPAKYMKWFGLLYRGGVLQSRMILSPDPATVIWNKLVDGQVVEQNLAELLNSLVPVTG